LHAWLVKESADAIAADALGTLTAATADLERQVRRTQQLAGLALLATVIAGLLVGLRLARGLARPIVHLAGAVERVNGGDYDASVAQREGGEIGRLITAFNQMTATLRRQRDEVRLQQEAVTERNRELEQALGDLQAATEAGEQLASTVRTMSVPVVPILRQVIVVPLVGEIDEERAQVLIQRLLAGVSAEQARMVILDITGVPFVDATLAGLLLQVAAAVELLGARCLLVGISPEVAQALVMSGADLSRLKTYADLRAGVEYAMRATRR
jgi:anti-anti-sigma factor